MSLLTATKTAPDQTARAYTLKGETAPVLGGGIVSQSHNNPKKGKADEFLTFQNGQTQQSCPLRAVGASIGADVVPFSEIIGILVDVGRLAEKDAATILKMVSAPQ